MSALAKIFKNTPWYVPAALTALIIYPFLVSNYFIDIAFFFGIYALLGLSLNIVLGEVGLFDLGHAGFYAIGAYVTAILNTRYQIPILALLPISAFAAALFAYIVCSPIIHLKGDYLCIVTIGMGEIVRLALINNPFDLTGGPNGVFGVDFPRLAPGLVIDSSIKYYFLIWAVVGLSILGLVSLQHSRIGRAWNCIREDGSPPAQPGSTYGTTSSWPLSSGRGLQAWRAISMRASSCASPPRASPSGSHALCSASCSSAAWAPSPG